MLGGPAVLGPRAVVVGPDDLVQEALPAEDGVQHHLGVVHLPVVQVQVQGAVVGEQPPCLDQSRFQEGPVVAESVVVLVQGALDRVVGPAFEPHPVAPACGVNHHCGSLARLDPAGVERRVHVNQGESAVRQRGEVVSVVRVHHQVAAVRRPDVLCHREIRPRCCLPETRPGHRRRPLRRCGGGFGSGSGGRGWRGPPRWAA